MNNDTVMYIAVAAAVLAVIALIMICQVRSSLNQSAAPAAIVAMGGGEIVSIRPAARPGWTTGARIAGVSGNQQF